jgi:replicative DNA helicase
VKVDLLKDHESEARLIGGAMLHPARLAEALDLVRTSDLHADRHQVVWEAARALYERGSDVNSITLRAELAARSTLQRAGGDDGLFKLTDMLVGAASIEPLAKHVRRVAVVREHQLRMMRLLAEAQEPIEDLDSFADRIESAFSRGSDRLLSGDPVLMNDLMAEVIESIVKQREGGKQLGYRTGLIELDNVLGGLVPAEHTVLAGRPGMGKSAAAQRLVLGVEQSSNLPALVVSREMSKLMFGRRVAAADARIDGNKLRTGTLSRDDWSALEASALRMSDRRVAVIDGKHCRSMLDVRRAARRLREITKSELSCIAIDYAQLMRSGSSSDSREQEVAEISGMAVDLAKEFNCHSLLLAQVNRDCEKRQDKRPMLSDLRESGALEQDADNVLFVYRDEYYNAESTARGIAEIIVAKQRSGPTGTIECAFNASSTSFENLERTQGSYANA